MHFCYYSTKPNQTTIQIPGILGWFHFSCRLILAYWVAMVCIMAWCLKDFWIILCKLQILNYLLVFSFVWVNVRDVRYFIRKMIRMDTAQQRIAGVKMIKKMNK
jgi:hypothetical protein